MDKYKYFKDGTITISKLHLRECFNDEDKRNQLEKNLSNATDMIKDSEENLEGYISTKVEINADGEIETVTYSGQVSFNQGKRASQIAAAKTSTDINMAMSLLSKDLADCESGLKNGFCDENEVNKVRAMIKNAQAKQQEIVARERSDKAEGKEIPTNLTISLLI